MSDSYELAILIIVSVILFIMVVKILWYAAHKRDVVIEHDPEHRFMTDKNLFRAKAKVE